MKIRELFIEEVGTRIIKAIYEFSCRTDETRKVNENLAKIKAEIESRLDGCKCHIATTGISFDITITVPATLTDEMGEFINDINSVLRRYLDMDRSVRENDDDHRCEIFFYKSLGQWPKKINFPAIHITPTAIPTVLTDIANIIGKCDYLEISHCHRVGGDVLGLVKLAKKMKVILTYPEVEPQWVGIINRHLKSGDILQCQEELIEAGLKMYAKF